ncbi:hypothetical protein D3C80_997720 [compost metagenome]
MICVALSTTKLDAVAPKVTTVAPVKFVPLMITFAPPVDGPAAGETDVTVGAVGAMMKLSGWDVV